MKTVPIIFYEVLPGGGSTRIDEGEKIDSLREIIHARLPSVMKNALNLFVKIIARCNRCLSTMLYRNNWMMIFSYLGDIFLPEPVDVEILEIAAFGKSQPVEDFRKLEERVRRLSGMGKIERKCTIS